MYIMGGQAELRRRSQSLMMLLFFWLGLAVGLPFEAPWGDAWTDASGNLRSTFHPVLVFYDCSVDTRIYLTSVACAEACRAGVLQFAPT